MNCPVCDDVRMKEVQKENVLIDVCPNCKGVWLDRGELEKITAGLKEDHKYYEETFDSYEREYRERPEYKKDYHKGYDSKHSPYGYKKKKKKTMLDLLDLF